jgi:hypothetical protein
MFRIISRNLIAVVAIVLAWPTLAASTVVFDFDDIQITSKKKGVSGAAIEVYMEGQYGSGLSVSPKATAVHGAPFYSSDSLSGLAVSNSYLTAGKGKGAASITIDFGDNPIDSFSVDFKLFKKAKSFSILADGELINHQTLSKAQKKAGLSGHQDAYFFDTPVHSLQFVGSKKKSFAIDNLVVDLPSDFDDGSSIGQSGSSFTDNVLPLGDTEGTDVNSALGDASINQVADVPEPASLLLFVLGSLGLILFSKSARFSLNLARRSPCRRIKPCQSIDA